MTPGVRNLLFTLIMVGLLAGAWYFVFPKATDQIARLRADTQNKQTQLDQVERALRDVEDVEKEMNDLKAKADMFDNKLPSAGDVQVILAQITAFGKKNKLDVKAVRTLRTDKMGNYMEDQMGMTVSGDFRQLYQFLLDIERMDRITRLGKIQLSRLKEEGAVSAELSLSIFYVPDAAVMN
jgi:type IV pilus assembly protein PilO